MSEGTDPRIITGAVAAADTGMCQIVLLGNEIIIKTECKKLGVELPCGIKITDPEKSDLLAEFEKEYLKIKFYYNFYFFLFDAFTCRYR